MISVSNVFEKRAFLNGMVTAENDLRILRHGEINVERGLSISQI